MQAFKSLKLEQDFSSLPSSFYQAVHPQGLDKPKLVIASQSCADELGVDISSLTLPDTLSILSGNSVMSGTRPLAMKYTGHQFGYYNPDLGDGRGLLLGELKNKDNTLWDLHLKGAGKTPFSRQGDGRAVLRSSIREFLGSEAMADLDIPTTRALCVVSTDSQVFREELETAATLLRVSQSHIRFGHFEYAMHTGGLEKLTALCDYVIKRYYPCLLGNPRQYQDLFKVTAQKTASLVAKWQAFGFAHGVMNTDNMSILGETFDYGPFGFLDRFQPNYICNHSDNEGRYAFDRQPSIAFWNLSVLAHAMSPLVEQDALNEGLQSFNQVFNEDYLDLLSAKLGFVGRPKDDSILVGTLDMMAKNHLDYSYFFRQLSDVSDEKVARKLKDLCINPAGFDQWLSDYTSSLKVSGTDKQRRVRMNTLNPKYILRNHLAQKAIEQAEKGDYSEVQKLHTILQNPFDEQDENSAYAKLPPSWSQDLEISCSS